MFALGMFVDGTARRKIKASAAGFVSPLSFHLAGHGLLLVDQNAFRRSGRTGSGASRVLGGGRRASRGAALEGR